MKIKKIISLGKNKFSIYNLPKEEQAPRPGSVRAAEILLQDFHSLI